MDTLEYRTKEEQYYYSRYTLKYRNLEYNSKGEQCNYSRYTLEYRYKEEQYNYSRLDIPLNTEVKKITLGIPWTSCSWRWMWICC